MKTDFNVTEVFEMAIRIEKESILFYLGLKDIVPQEYGRKQIDDIITEEKKHIVQLNEFLKIAKKNHPRNNTQTMKTGLISILDKALSR